MSVHDLSDEQIAAARQLYDDGDSLGEVARRVGCGLYDLSPWLYMEHASMQAMIARVEERIAADRENSEP